MESQTPAGYYVSRLHPRRRYFVKGTSTTIPALTSSCIVGIQERKLSIEVQPPQAAKTEKKITKKKITHSSLYFARKYSAATRCRFPSHARGWRNISARLRAGCRQLIMACCNMAVFHQLGSQINI